MRVMTAIFTVSSKVRELQWKSLFFPVPASHRFLQRGPFVKRYLSVLRCLRHGFVTPILEYRRYGRVHYAHECGYLPHLARMIALAFRLACFLPLSRDDRDFYT